ncbi:DUF2231 domain-containing protein [Micromonospora mirobrigensis]|uniref:DUF2231 domain-containing protein n=1 Tax=Micromonospora mirobrigensis TaxID=262898 RepID=A0A1C4UXT0_9ACTN|nr:DUF2231 domain-containing protein [Micromonospora mirobrigensis]SCE76504.1 hypothetical protein GA0070564_101798 [Micromonospora mirobrigensis]
MFREINGLPGHILVVHAVVVLVPLLAVLAVAYGVLPRWRSRLGWAVAALAVLAPIFAFVATESGEAFQEVLEKRGYPAQALEKIHEHSEYGENLLWFTVGLAVAALALLVLTSNHPRVPRLPRWAVPALIVVVAVLAVLALVYAYLTGDSGAQAVWGTTL